MKKIIAVLLTVLVATTLFTACDTPVKDKPELIMATNATFPPYEFYDDDTNEIVGIDVEIAQLIADKLGMTLVVEDMEFGSIIGAVQTGKAHIGLAGMTVDEERLKSVDFSHTYATGVQVVIVAENSDIASLDDLVGKQIGVQENTTGDIYSTDDYGDEFVNRYSSGANAVLALTQGKVDAVIIDNEPAKNFIAVNGGLTILETEYAIEDYAIALAKGSELTDKVNKALTELIDDGSVQTIIDKYIPKS